MATKPLDTTSEGWAIQRDALAQMGSEARVRTALDLSEAVREMQLQGVLARNPSWGRSEAVQWLIRTQLDPRAGRP